MTRHTDTNSSRVKPPKYLRPSLSEVKMGVILRFVPSQKRRIAFTPTEILAMYDYALQKILDLSDEGVRNVQAEARWLQRHLERKRKQ